MAVGPVDLGLTQHGELDPLAPDRKVVDRVVGAGLVTPEEEAALSA